MLLTASLYSSGSASTPELAEGLDSRMEGASDGCKAKVPGDTACLQPVTVSFLQEEAYRRLAGGWKFLKRLLNLAGLHELASLLCWPVLARLRSQQCFDHCCIFWSGAGHIVSPSCCRADLRSQSTFALVECLCPRVVGFQLASTRVCRCLKGYVSSWQLAWPERGQEHDSIR